jgi:hypothetical protein
MTESAPEGDHLGVVYYMYRAYHGMPDSPQKPMHYLQVYWLKKTTDCNTPWRSGELLLSWRHTYKGSDHYRLPSQRPLQILYLSSWASVPTGELDFPNAGPSRQQDQALRPSRVHTRTKDQCH